MIFILKENYRFKEINSENGGCFITSIRVEQNKLLILKQFKSIYYEKP